MEALEIMSKVMKCATHTTEPYGDTLAQPLRKRERAVEKEKRQRASGVSITNICMNDGSRLLSSH